jgi:hypothetical protein
VLASTKCDFRVKEKCNPASKQTTRKPTIKKNIRKQKKSDNQNRDEANHSFS